MAPQNATNASETTSAVKYLAEASYLKSVRAERLKSREDLTLYDIIQQSPDIIHLIHDATTTTDTRARACTRCFIAFSAAIKVSAHHNMRTGLLPLPRNYGSLVLEDDAKLENSFVSPG